MVAFSMERRKGMVGSVVDKSADYSIDSWTRDYNLGNVVSLSSAFDGRLLISSLLAITYTLWPIQ